MAFDLSTLYELHYQMITLGKVRIYHKHHTHDEHHEHHKHSVPEQGEARSNAGQGARAMKHSITTLWGLTTTSSSLPKLQCLHYRICLCVALSNPEFGKLQAAHLQCQCL